MEADDWLWTLSKRKPERKSCCLAVAMATTVFTAWKIIIGNNTNVVLIGAVCIFQACHETEQISLKACVL